MSGGTPAPPQPVRRLRHRRNARRLTEGQLDDLRQAVRETQQIGDERGYQYWAGVHGLPLPIHCRHHDHLFLPWHRAYLYFFEKALQDAVAGVTLPWWDWSRHHDEGLPPAYARRRDRRGRANSLYDSPIQPSGRSNPRVTRTNRDSGAPGALPSPASVDRVLKNSDYSTFQTQLESLHDGIHMWVGGTMGSVATAAYDPVFWAHHAMIDRLWYLWQLRHPGAGPPASSLDTALPPFSMTVRQTLDVTRLGYDYAATTTATGGPGGG